MDIQEIELEQIVTDGGTQMRDRLNGDVIDEYRDRYQDGEDMPPITVFYDGSTYWLGDGFHRYFSAREAGLMTMECEIHDGTQRDAQWHAIAANQSHGLRRTNADKRKAVAAALDHPKGRKLSDRAIAEHCGVSHDFVSRKRRQVSSDDTCDEPETRTGRDGKEYPASNNDPEPWPGEDNPADDEGFYDSDDDAEAAEPQVDLVKQYDSPVKSFVRQIGKLQTDFAVLQDQNEFTRHFYNSIVAEDFRQRLNNAKNVVTAHRPHAVCPHCDAEGCEECGDSGVLTRGKADKVL